MRRINGAWIAGIDVAAGLYSGAAALELVPGAGWYYERRFFRELLECDTTFPKLEDAIDSPRSFHGDGFSVARYSLSEDVSACVSGLESGQQVLPRPMRDRAGWAIRPWRSAPLTTFDQKLVQWALSPEGKHLSEEIRLSLLRNTTRYAMLYKGNATEDDPIGHILNVDLFVIDPVTGKLYILNLNT